MKFEKKKKKNHWWGPLRFDFLVFCDGHICVSAFFQGKGTQGCSRTSGERMSMGTSPYVNNSVFISLPFSHFIEKKYFHGNMGTYKIGGVPLE
jgi:hypothetical protein